MSEEHFEYRKDWELQLNRIADTLEGTNKLLADIVVYLKAGDIIKEMKSEDQQFTKEKIIHEDTKTVTIQKAKYIWYPLKDGGKVRACNNKPCPYYLRWNDEKKSYEHGKYDPETKEFFFVNDICEYYGG